MKILEILNNKDWSLLIYTFLCEKLDRVIPTDEVNTLILGLSMYYGISQNQMLDKIINHYCQKENIGVWRFDNKQFYKYARYKVD